ncbi:MAG: hypothetical protein VB852_03780 [Deltaproteobacteria bacterium]
MSASRHFEVPLMIVLASFAPPFPSLLAHFASVLVVTAMAGTANIRPTTRPARTDPMDPRTNILFIAISSFGAEPRQTYDLH